MAGPVAFGSVCDEVVLVDVVELEVVLELAVELVLLLLLLLAAVELVADVVLVVLGGGHDSEALATPVGRVSDDRGAPGGSGK